MFSTNFEDILFYADTYIFKVIVSNANCIVHYESWNNEKSTLTFTHHRIISKLDIPNGDRVETGQLIKLKNSRNRIVLFDDDNEIILEIEYKKCLTI